MVKYRPIPKGMRDGPLPDLQGIRKRKCGKCGKRLNDCTCLCPILRDKNITPRAIAIQHGQAVTHDRSNLFLNYFCFGCGQGFLTIESARSHIYKYHNANYSLLRRSSNWSYSKSGKRFGERRYHQLMKADISKED